MYTFRTKAPSPESSTYHDAAGPYGTAKMMEMRVEPKNSPEKPTSDKG